jgi:hypothetical protein
MESGAAMLNYFKVLATYKMEGNCYQPLPSSETRLPVSVS